MSLTWTTIVESAQSQESTTALAGRSTLTLQASPRVRHVPTVMRNPAEVPTLVTKHVDALCRGKLPWPLFLFGPAGTGKTCAALCLLDFVEEGTYHTCESFSQAIIDAQQGRLTTESGREVSPTYLWTKEISKVDLFVLDELGSRRQVSDHQYNVVKSLLDYREGKPTVVISNLSLNAIREIYDDRVTSRLAAGTVIQVEGDDRRVQRSPSKASHAPSHHEKLFPGDPRIG